MKLIPDARSGAYSYFSRLTTSFRHVLTFSPLCRLSSKEKKYSRDSGSHFWGETSGGQRRTVPSIRVHQPWGWALGHHHMTTSQQDSRRAEYSVTDQQCGQRDRIGGVRKWGAGFGYAHGQMKNAREGNKAVRLDGEPFYYYLPDLSGRGPYPTPITTESRRLIGRKGGRPALPGSTRPPMVDVYRAPLVIESQLCWLVMKNFRTGILNAPHKLV